MTIKNPRAHLAVAVVLTSALSGCGGGGGGGDSAPPPAGMNPPPVAAGDTFAITSANRLVSFNRASPATASVVNVTGLRANETIFGIDLRPGGSPAGQVIAVSSMGAIYTIDPNSGTATLKSTLRADPTDDMVDRFTMLTGTRVSIDTNNLADRLRIVSNSGQNLRVNVDTGETFTDTPLTVGGVTSIGVTEVAYTNNFSSTCRTTPFYLDTTSDRLLVSANASGGVLTAVGGLRVDAAAMSGFDIVTAADGTNAAFAVLTVASVTSLYSIDLTTGVATVVGQIGGLNAGESVFGLAAPAPATTPVQPVGELLALTMTNGLVSFNSSFPQKLCTTASINGLQGSESVLGIDMRPVDSNVYALTDAGRLYTVNAATGTVAFKAALKAAAGDTTLPFQALDGTNVTVDVSPVADGLRVITNTGSNLRVVFDTGDTFTDTQLNPPGSSVTAAAYTNSFAQTGTSTLYVLDTANDRLLAQGRAPGSPINGDLQVIGSLKITGDVQAVAGFDINAINNTAFAALSVDGATTSDLYRINLSTGEATRVNPIGATSRIRAITHSTVPQATVLGVTSDARLISFKAATPGTLDSNAPIRGMQGGEQILGFDVRPSNGLLYLLTDAGRVYILDPATAMAQLGPSLTPNNILVGTTYGIDFSPTADALRVISDAERNIAVVVESGNTITATPLARIMAESASRAPDVIAIAYTNNFAGTLDTTLYDIDLATNSLLSQRPANAGLVTTIGPLGGTQPFSFTGGFDIAGGEDGLAVAALETQGAGQSTLYRVNLRTGALTAVGAIGPAGTMRLSGLTIRLQ